MQKKMDYAGRGRVMFIFFYAVYDAIWELFQDLKGKD